MSGTSDGLWWISLSYATFGLIVSGGRIARCAPIARWSTTKEISLVLGYYRRKGAEIAYLG